MPVPSPWPLLIKRFPTSEYCLLQEVRDAAGFNASRSADGIAMNFWNSRGLAIHGIEVKSYRNDWQKELKQPEKAENILQYCDHFWLVCAAEGIAKPEEIPTNWGFMEVRGKRLVTVKEAPKLTPVPPTKTFMAAMLRRATKGLISPTSIQEKIDEARQAGIDSVPNNRAYEHDRLKIDHEELLSAVKEFQDASGIEIGNGWRFDNKRMGEAVKFIMDNGLDEIGKRLQNLFHSSKSIHESIAKGLPIFENTENIIVGE